MRQTDGFKGVDCICSSLLGRENWINCLDESRLDDWRINCLDRCYDRLDDWGGHLGLGAVVAAVLRTNCDGGVLSRSFYGDALDGLGEGAIASGRELKVARHGHGLAVL